MFRRPVLVARVVKIQIHHNIFHVPYDRPTRVDLLEKYPHAAEVLILSLHVLFQKNFFVCACQSIVDMVEFEDYR